MLERGFEFAPGYRLQEFLGRGQFGQVWRASVPGGTAAAVKFIDLTEGSGQKEYTGVKRVKQIRQANLMPITAIWLLDNDGHVIDEPPDDATQTIDGSAPGAHQTGMVVTPQVEPAWLVVAMLLGGQSLLHRLRECTKQGLRGIPPKELLSYMDESAKGLDFLNQPRHDLGEGPVAIQHCDVKPANIVMIGTSAVVCDFGLARILSRNQITATSASGTPAYMAPEAIGGKPSRTSDQYSLAVTYFHLRTGSLPIKEGTLYEVMEAHRHGKLDFGGIGKAEQRVLRKATDLDWQKRFETNADFVDALREALRSEGFAKPKYVPQDSSAELPETIDAPQVHQDTNADPTATIESDFGQPRPDDVETIDLAGQGGDAPQPATTKPSRLKPQYIVSAAVVCLLMFGLIQMLPSGGETNPPKRDRQEASDNGSGLDRAQSPDELLALALTEFNSDESKAAELFRKAINLDPSIVDVEPRVLSKHGGAIERLLQTPDGSYLVSIGYDNAPFVWDIDSVSDNTNPQALQKGSDPIYPDALVLSVDGKRILCGSGVVPSIWTIEGENTADTRIELPKHDNELLAVAWHPTDDQFVATASADGKIGITEIASPTVDLPHGSIARSKLFDSAVVAEKLAFDPAGKYLVLIGEQGDVRSIEWSELVTRLDDDSAPNAVRINAEGTRAVCIDFVQSMDEKTLVTVGSLDGSITLWELVSESVQRDRFAAHDPSSIEAIKVARTGERCVVAAGGGDGKISAWPITRPEQRKTFPVSTIAVAAIDISEDGRWIAAGCNDGSVWLWDHQADKIASLLTEAKTVDSVRIDSTGRWLIAGCGDGTIRVWDLVHCKLVALTIPVIETKTQREKPANMTQVSTGLGA